MKHFFAIENKHGKAQLICYTIRSYLNTTFHFFLDFIRDNEIKNTCGNDFLMFVYYSQTLLLFSE